MNQPLVSVVIPVYNVEKYLDRCIVSIVEQTYRNTEIILVDDGSKDNSPSICDSWAERDGRIRVIHKQNAGAGMARNTGIDNACGDYILFVDSDDYIDLSTVEKCVQLHQKDNSDIVMFGRVEAKKNGETQNKPILTDKYYFENEEVTEDILSGLFINEKGFGVGVCGKMFRLPVIKDSGIRFRSERELLSEDAFFLVELFEHITSVSILPENFYYYYQNENSFSRTYKKEHQKLNDGFLACCMQACERLGYSEKVVRHIKVRYHIYVLTGMKQIVASDMSAKEKKKALKQIQNNQILKSTLSDDVLILANRQSMLFWKLFRNKCFWLCILMLRYKAR